MKQAYITKVFNAEHMRIVEHADRILSEYARERMVMTLRQLYYQFVARDLFEKKYSHNGTKWVPDQVGGTINAPNNYKLLGNVINDARMAGYLDWDYMEDRTRSLTRPSYWSGVKSILESAAWSYKRDLWESQDTYVEVWVEKEALAGVIESACLGLRVPFFSCRGYTSQSEQREAGVRFAGALNEGKDVVVLHLGDHDPSGIDMTRDNDERLRRFIEGDLHDTYDVERFEFRRLALSMEQIHQYNPPPNPAKMTDSRFGGYEAEYGDESWELDALEPRVIRDLITQNVEELIDYEKWDEAKAIEELGKTDLLAMAAAYADKTIRPREEDPN